MGHLIRAVLARGMCGYVDTGVTFHQDSRGCQPYKCRLSSMGVC
jgi:hypothetical protein